MSIHLPEFNRLLRQARTGDNPAAQELVERFTPFMQRVIRRRLDRRMRTAFDSADFSQAAWASFFALPSDQHDFQKPEELVRFLEEVARNKVIEQIRRRLGTRNRRVRQEIPFENVDQFRAPSSTASQEAIAQERWRQALEKQPRHQEIMNSFRVGFSQKEIADQLGISERTVRRAIRRLQLGLE
jgi:RNA polymerase sigma factor (sigma-70 family)